MCKPKVRARMLKMILHNGEDAWLDAKARAGSRIWIYKLKHLSANLDHATLRNP
jgi:hypothetical protein